MDVKHALVVCMVLIYRGCLGYDPEASITGLYTGPYFDPLAARNLTAHMEDRAVLPCTVRQLGDKSVSWVRMRDADILTVDRYTFVGDERFEAHYSPAHETWNLIIKYVQERDAGMYECQVSTEPKMSQLFSLRVVVPRVSMLPPGDRYVKAGSKVKIECQITDVVQQPDYIFWYHDGIRVLENRDSNIKVNVKKTGDESLMSTLIISRVRRDESGNYTCMPSNLHASSVLLHVLNEEHPEAMKDGRNASCKMEQPLYLVLLFLISTLLGRLFTNYSLPEKKKRTLYLTENRRNSIYTDENAINMLVRAAASQQTYISYRHSDGENANASGNETDYLAFLLENPNQFVDKIRFLNQRDYFDNLLSDQSVFHECNEMQVEPIRRFETDESSSPLVNSCSAIIPDSITAHEFTAQETITVSQCGSSKEDLFKLYSPVVNEVGSLPNVSDAANNRFERHNRQSRGTTLITCR